VDDIRNGAGHVDDTQRRGGLALGHEWFDPERRAAGEYSKAEGTEIITNNVVFNLPHLTNEANVAGYLRLGRAQFAGSSYAVNKCHGRETAAGI